MNYHNHFFKCITSIVLAVLLLLSAVGCGTAAVVVCPSCNEEVASENNFCIYCGIKMKITCSSCNEEVAAGSNFCTQCGAEIAQGNVPADEDINPQPTDIPSGEGNGAAAPVSSSTPTPTPGIALTSYYPLDNMKNYVPTYGYCSADFSKEIDPNRYPTAHMINHTTGKEYTLKTKRGDSSYTSLLVLFNNLLEPNCKYTITIPANSIYGTDGSVYTEELTFSFTTAKTLN